jgi:hypothetical protein
MLRDIHWTTEKLGNRTNAQTYGQVANKHIPPHIVVRIGRSLRFKESALLEFIDQGGALKGENEAAQKQVETLASAA